MPAGHRVVVDLHRCTCVYQTRADLVAALVVALSRAKDAVTVVTNYPPGLLLQIPTAEAEQSDVTALVTSAFLGAVQRLLLGRVTSVVPRKVRLRQPSRKSLQTQLNLAFRDHPAVAIVRWDQATATATLRNGLEVQAIKALE